MKKQCTLFIAAIALASVQHVAAQSWNITGNSNATTSSKLGTTNSIPLRLYTNNTQRVTITADGKMGVNTTTPPGLFTVQSNGSVPNAKWAPASTQPVFFGFSENLNADFSLAAASNDAKQRPLFFGKRSRGTLAAPTAVKTDDYLTSMAIYAYDGSAFQVPATIDFYADGTPSSGKVPSRISFVTGSNAGDRLERLKIGSTGDINFNAGQLLVEKASGNVTVGTGNLNFSTIAQTLQFPAVSSTAAPMINMFASGTINDNRMVIGHSPAYPNWGLQYSDLNDDFDFLQAGTSILHIGLNSTNIGISKPAPTAKLDIVNTSAQSGIVVNNAYSTSNDYYGVNATSVNNPGWGFGVKGTGGYTGVYGFGNGTSYTSSVFGVYGSAYGSAGVRYGVYGTASGGTTNYAGYFNGNVFAAGSYLTSDRKFKTAIAPLGNPLDKLMKLKPATYKFKSGEFSKMMLPEGEQMGLIADEVKQVFPELVKEGIYPAEYSDDRKQVLQPEIKYDAVNYTGLIPALIGSIQELKKQNDLQQQQIEDLKEMVKQLAGAKDVNASLSNVTLAQNNPNPLNEFTTIRYNIPGGSRNAQLIVTDITGKKIKQIDLSSSPAGVVNFDASALASGSYTYSIVVDGKVAETKKMVVTKP